MTTLSIAHPSLANIPPPNEDIQSEGQTPKPIKWCLEGATRTGQIRHENQDAYSFFQKGDVTCAIMCDGAGGHEGGGEASQTATEIMQASLLVDIRKGLSPSECLLRAIKTARDQFKSAKLEGITTAILVIFDEDYIHYATLGDGALVAVYPDGMISQIQTPHHLLGQPSNIIAAYIGQDCEVAPRIGSVRIEPGTTVMLMSDGASDLFPYDDFAANHAVYSEYLLAKEKPSLSDHILKQIEAARDPDTGAYLHHDNMTLVTAHYPSEERHPSLVKTLEDTSDA